MTHTNANYMKPIVKRVKIQSIAQFFKGIILSMFNTRIRLLKVSLGLSLNSVPHMAHGSKDTPSAVVQNAHNTGNAGRCINIKMSGQHYVVQFSIAHQTVQYNTVQENKTKCITAQQIISQWGTVQSILLQQGTQHYFLYSMLYSIYNTTQNEKKSQYINTWNMNPQYFQNSTIQ